MMVQRKKTYLCCLRELWKGADECLIFAPIFLPVLIILPLFGLIVSSIFTYDYIVSKHKNMPLNIRWCSCK